MEECNLSLVKHRLSFRQAGEYLRKPVLETDIKMCVKSFELLNSTSDSDSVSEISNILIDKNDMPEKILTLKDYKKKLKAVGGRFKYIDSFTDCYKTVMIDVQKENVPFIDDISNEIENVQQIIKDILNHHVDYQDTHYEEHSSKFLDESVLIPNPDEYILADDNGSEITLSTYWKLLEESDPKDINSKNNNEYNFEKSHWLDRPPVSWEVIDAAVKKCEVWLKKYFKT